MEEEAEVLPPKKYLDRATREGSPCATWVQLTRAPVSIYLTRRKCIVAYAKALQQIDLLEAENAILRGNHNSSRRTLTNLTGKMERAAVRAQARRRKGKVKP